MSGAHKTTLRIYGPRGQWQGDAVVYLTDEGKANLIDLLTRAELSPGNMISGVAVDVLLDDERDRGTTNH